MTWVTHHSYKIRTHFLHFQKYIVCHSQKAKGLLVPYFNINEYVAYIFLKDLHFSSWNVIISREVVEMLSHSILTPYALPIHSETLKTYLSIVLIIATYKIFLMEYIFSNKGDILMQMSFGVFFFFFFVDYMTAALSGKKNYTHKNVAFIKW